jgi:SulP family sulfate permease
VAAIEMDMGQALDTNAELITVGVSNFISGLLGGFTGSYIFSQTIFGFRTGFHFRSVAVVMIVLQVIVFVIKLDPLSFVPLFFFAATLIFIGIDLMLEWLIEVSKCSAV